ncbi:hypothetical protein [Limnoraphis robusta]|uniref:Uncharacterized protein n=1 Tax=Limnoraphis robusta CS-951 TaxID=1637645 RepID=A0A0F5YAY0_9CYAN|nr:hypothetical protein [Limnoraphis robusta]KKD35898.1 hypothetical protein WN50_22735 [Limnoraphis robusta CS-951]
MLIVLASCYDEAARFWVENWTDGDVTLLTPDDLSKTGWRHYLGSLQDSTAVINDQVISVEQITGVLTRLPCVFEQELLSIVENDRPYVAAEMTAFLGSWLAHLSCPILNRPTPTCLMGTNWRHQQWIYAASQVGMSVETQHQYISLNAEPQALKIPSERVSVTVIGDRYIGEVDPILGTKAQKLAQFAGVELLVVHYNHPEAGGNFISADLWPNLKSSEITIAILEYLNGK